MSYKEPDVFCKSLCVQEAGERMTLGESQVTRVVISDYKLPSCHEQVLCLKGVNL